MRLVVLRGLTRVTNAMGPVAESLRTEGHEAHVVRYPSREGRLQDHARVVLAAVDGLGIRNPREVGWVAHSLGGLVLRAMARARPGLACGPCVVFGAPMTGSILVDRLGDRAWVRGLVGPTIDDLRSATVAELPPIPAARLLSIAGATAHPLLPTTPLLWALAPGRPSDSLVLVDETRVPGAHHAVVPGVHFMLPRSPAVHRAIADFVADQGSVASAQQRKPVE